MDEIQKELRVRTRILNIYNKRREDFATKDEWDDYLEMVEDSIFNIVNRIDVAATEAKVAEYERTNRLNIIANQARMAEEFKKAQQASAAQATVGDDKGPSAAFNAVSFKPQTLLAVAPMPLVPPAVDADGRLVMPPVKRAQFDLMAAASGWSAELPKARAIKEAFSSVLIS